MTRKYNESSQLESKFQQFKQTSASYVENIDAQRPFEVRRRAFNNEKDARTTLKQFGHIEQHLRKHAMSRLSANIEEVEVEKLAVDEIKGHRLKGKKHHVVQQYK